MSDYTRRPGKRRRSRVEEAAERLRELALEHLFSNAFVGSESDLLQRLGVSRPTLHQAARLLEHEELLTIRRGVGGGYFARAPSEDSVARVTSIFLQSRNVDMYAIAQVTGTLLVEAARIVAEKADLQARMRVCAYVERYGPFCPDDDPAAYVGVVVNFERMLAELSGNAVLALLVNVLGQLAQQERPRRFVLGRDQAQSYARHLQKLSSAIQAGQVDTASRLVEANNARVLGWLRPR